MELCDRAPGRSRRRGRVVERALTKPEAVAAARGERNHSDSKTTKKKKRKIKNMYKIL